MEEVAIAEEPAPVASAVQRISLFYLFWIEDAYLKLLFFASGFIEPT